MNEITGFPDVLLQKALRERFGHEEFRPGQLAVLRSVLSGRPTLVVMPTGAGKSLCYQLPAVLLDGMTLVISPLVALMKDQVDALRAKGIAAAFVNSSQSEADRAQAESEVESGRAKLVYVAPERFRSPSFMRILAIRRPALVAVDEAHCISEWGHTFRPDYARLGDVLAAVKPPRLAALTATASPDVRADIARSLRMHQPCVMIAGFDRPNLHLEVHRLSTEAEKRDSVLAAVTRMSPAIVYTATRKQAGTMARHLAQHGVECLPYHAGLEAPERRRVQEMFARGALRVVAATNAFGLGVDKSDVRLVVHSEIPRSLESYYQEVGRAGRDGRPAVGALFFAKKDLVLQRCLLGWSNPRASAVASAWAALKHAGGPVPHEGLVDAVQTRSRMEALSAVAFLESSGLLVRSRVAGPQKLLLRGGPGEPGSEKAAIARVLGGCRGIAREDELSQALGAADGIALKARLDALERAGELKRLPGGDTIVCAPAAGASLEEQHLHSLRVRTMREQARFAAMIAFASSSDCRRRALLRALGEEYLPASCGACDVCAGHRLQPVLSRLPGISSRPRRSRDAVRQGGDRVDSVSAAC